VLLLVSFAFVVMVVVVVVVVMEPRAFCMVRLAPYIALPALLVNISPP
jgi:hypothetical protein